jgi:hypothetical protein
MIIGFSNGSLLPLVNRAGSMLADFWADPFRVLENIPFWLHRGDKFDWKETLARRSRYHVGRVKVEGGGAKDQSGEPGAESKRREEEGRGEERESLALGGDIAWQVYMHESEGQNRQMALKKSRFNAENRRNALLVLILIVKTSSSTEIIVQYPSVKTLYNSIPFCKVVPFFYYIYILSYGHQKNTRRNSNIPLWN